jgi:putative heme-binding domain-containing protein
VRQAALESLTRSRDPKIPEILLADWKGSTPAVRDAILDALLSRGPWTSALLSALEEGRVPPAEIGAVQRRRLLEHRDKEMRRRSTALFAGRGGSRNEVVEAYRDALTLKGDPNAGAAVFKKVCATCHRLNGEGYEVGPDLAALTDKTPEALLVAILDPNRAFEAKYANFAVQTTDGRVLSGIIAAETGNAVTLRREEGRDETLLRADIEEIAGSGQSLMPEGLEKDLSKQAVADLIAFLSSTGPPRKTVSGNHPQRVTPKADGSIVLKAEDAELYGDTLTFENHYGNLGYWSSPNDRAAWTFDTPKPGRYAVRISWACDDGSQGNTLALEVDRDTLDFKVTGTGAWDDYRSKQVGEVNLGPGPHRLVARPVGPIRGALIDLREVELRPAAPSGGGNATCCGGGD